MTRLVALAAALALAGVGVYKGTWAVGGSDSSCYALMAEAFAHGRLQPSSPIAAVAPWPDVSRTLAPAGFIPSPARPGAASPVCSPGMSVLMAPLVAIGGRDALFLLSPLAAAVLVWLTSVLARRLAGGMAGAVAAVLVATSPIVLFQAVQPMNDIVTGTLWVAAIAAATGGSRNRAGTSGVLTGLAILVRPNLALVGAVVAMGMLSARRAEPSGSADPADSAGPEGSAPRTAVVFAFAALPGIALLLLLNHLLYGNPFSSGYGHAADLFSLSFVGENVAHYTRAILDTQTLFPALAVLAPVVFAEEGRRLSWSMLAAAGAVWLSYVFYRPYPEWWYLRFLLPAMALLIALASAVCARLATRARMGGVLAIATVVLALFTVRTTGAREAFELQRLEGRFRDTGRLVSERLPDRAVLITEWQSGSLRFHASREAVLWGSLDPAWLDRAVAWLTAQGRRPYILVERREEADFRGRFGGHSELGALDWPPRFDINRQVRIFDPADRMRHLAGEAYATEIVR